MTRLRLALLFLLTATASLSADVKRVQFVRPPAFISDQDVIRLQIRVERHADNRMLIIAAAEDGMIVRRSDEQLDGTAAPRTRWIDLRFPAGDLMLAAILYDADGEVDRDVHPLHVSSSLP